MMCAKVAVARLSAIQRGTSRVAHRQCVLDAKTIQRLKKEALEAQCRHAGQAHRKPTNHLKTKP